jgi:hypothetical protein
LPDPLGTHCLEVTPEVVGLQKQDNAPSSLVADERLLFRLRSTRQHNRRSGGAGRGDNDPALVLIRLVFVLDEPKIQRLGEETDRFTIVADHEGDMGDRLAHAPSRLAPFFGCASLRWPGAPL